MKALHISTTAASVRRDCGGDWIDETRRPWRRRPIERDEGSTPRIGSALGGLHWRTEHSFRTALHNEDAAYAFVIWPRGPVARSGARLVILRVPGIYAGDRLPLARLAAGTPVLRATEDAYTNHIHADDLARQLARLIVKALQAGAPQRVYHAVDDSAMKMGDWFDLIADTHGLERPDEQSRSGTKSREGA